MESTNETKRTVLIVDDHPIVTEGLGELINQQPDLILCGTADCQSSALEKIERLKPDLVVADISLKGSNGIELLKDIKLRSPKTPVLILTMHDENLYSARALRAGASGLVMKKESPEQVLNAIRTVLEGGVFLSGIMEKKLLQQFLGRAPQSESPMDALSDRELEVFTLLGQGQGTRQIAEQLHLSVKTIESHRMHIKEKLNLKDGKELVQHAMQWSDR